MQNLTEAPRDALTAAQVTALLTGPWVQVTGGLELLDTSDVLIDDISDDLDSGSVSRNMYAAVHGTCSLKLARELQWGRDRVRPYLTLSAGGVEARFNLGVFVLTTPKRNVEESPETFDVTGYDKLHLLQGPIGDTYTVPAGTSYLTAVATVIAAAGAGTNVNLDGTASAKTLPADMVWPLSETEQASYLKVANDLLAAIGYRGLWADQNGTYRSEPYLAPAQRAVEWAFDLDDARTNIVGEQRTVTSDVWGVPNWWRFIQRSLETAPSEGAGQYTVTNASSGLSSYASLGRYVRKVVYLDAADQAALVSQGNRIVAEDQQVLTTVALTTGPFPIAGHFDVATYSDRAYGVQKVQAREWQMSLLGEDMSWTWEVVG